MHKLKLAYSIMRIIIFGAIVAIFILAGLQVVPLIAGNDAQYINQAGLQRTRCEVFAKSVLSLEYRSTGERTQAVSDIETALPLFESEETTLLASRASDVQELLQAQHGDYLAIVTALNMILAHPEQIDPVQVNIILVHDRPFLTVANQIVTLLQQHTDEEARNIFGIEVGIEAGLLCIICYIAFISPIVNRHVLGFKSNRELMQFIEGALENRARQKAT